MTFSDLDEFASIVTDFFKKRIIDYLSVNVSSDDLSETDKQQLMQDVFIAKRGELLIGREDEVNSMMDFTCNESEGKCLLVIAEPGTGKSALVAHHVLRMKEVYIFIYISV